MSDTMTDRRSENLAALLDFSRLLTVEGRASEAFAKYFAPDLIQHDAWIGDGSHGDDEYISAREEAEPDAYDSIDAYANVAHTYMADENFVAVKSHVFTSAKDPGREFVDIWKVENGKFVEHWDIIQPVTDEMRGSVGCGVGNTYAEAKERGPSVDNPACGSPDRAVNSAESKRIVLEYMAMGEEPGRRAEAVEKYNSPDLVQHASRIPGGRQGLIDYLTARDADPSVPKRKSTIQRVVADGDMVLVHRLVTSDANPTGWAYVDLFRLKDGKIAEHWDVIQRIPAFSASGRSMTGGPDDPLEPGRHVGPAPAGHPDY